MTPADLVGVVAFGNTLKVVANFTNDRDLLRAIGGSPGARARSGTGLAGRCRHRRQWRNRRHGRHRSGIHGRRHRIQRLQHRPQTRRHRGHLRSPRRYSREKIPDSIHQRHHANRRGKPLGTDRRHQLRESLKRFHLHGGLARTADGHAGRRRQHGRVRRHGHVHGRDRHFAEPVARRIRATHWPRSRATPAGALSSIPATSAKYSRACRTTLPATTWWATTARTRRATARWRSVHVKINQLPAGAHVRTREGYYAPRISASSRRKTANGNSKRRSARRLPKSSFPWPWRPRSSASNANQMFVPIAAKLAPSALQWAQKRGSHETAFDFAAEVRDAKSNRVVGALRDTITVKMDTEHFQDCSSARWSIRAASFFRRDSTN